MERQDQFTLPSDLQNFGGEPFSSHDFSNSLGLNSHHQQQQEQQHHHQQSFAGQGEDFNNFQMLHDNVNQINRAVNDPSRSANDDNMTGKPNDTFSLTFDKYTNHSQSASDVGMAKTQVIHQLLSTQTDQQQQQHQQSSPEYSKGSPVSSTGSPYTDSNLSPFDSTQNSSYMEMDSHHSHLQDFSHSLKYPDTSTQSTLIKGCDRLRLDSFNTENCLDDVKPKLEWSDSELENKTGKVARMPQDSDASSALSPSVDRVFNPEEAQQEVPKEFTFTVFGTQSQKSDEPTIELLPFGEALSR